MVIHLLIVSCHCYGDEGEIWRQRLCHFSYTITSTNRHATDSFMAVQTSKYFDSSQNLTMKMFVFDQLPYFSCCQSILWNISYRICWIMNSGSVLLRVKIVWRSLRQADKVFVKGSAIKQCNCKIQKRHSKEWHREILLWIKRSPRVNPKQPVQW